MWSIALCHKRLNDLKVKIKGLGFRIYDWEPRAESLGFSV
jgi:hypothetical protein